MKTFKNSMGVFLFAAITLSSCQARTKEYTTVGTDRQPAVAGSFYPASPEALTKQLSAFFRAADKKVSEDPLALIVPHAGYVFSGQAAAEGYRQLDPSKKYDRIFLIGSSHTMYFEGASIYTEGDFLTPLGKVRVDPLAKELVAENRLFSDDPAPHIREHSLEVQLPFLQYWLENDFTIVPIIMGGENTANFRKMAEILKPWFNERNLFIISTDFSHYPGYEDAVRSDARMAEAILTNSPEQFLKTRRQVENSGIDNLQTALCGWTSVYTLLNITENMPDVIYRKLMYTNSGESPYGDKERVVGYNAICVIRTQATGEKTTFRLSDEEEIELLKLSRQTLSTYLRDKQVSRINEQGLPPALLTPTGAFVTLNKDGRLRGCIGTFKAENPLCETIQQMTLAAATQDPRFSPVSKGELDHIEIEISVLTPMHKINSIDEIELGRHGIYIKKGASSGTFLPQVADETGWTRQEFLGHCARDKAGIGWDGWKTADIYIYEALVFSEHEFNLR